MVSLPKDIGKGITVNIGKFGQYIKQGGKSRSLTGQDNIFNITLERAEELLENVAEKPEAKVLGQHPKLKADIQIATGRYGEYIKCGKNNYRIPKGVIAKDLTFEEAVKIIDGSK